VHARFGGGHTEKGIDAPRWVPTLRHVNRLKLIKRSMYGRAEIDLLKLRVLYHSKKSQDRKNKRNKKQGQQVVHLKKPKSMKNGATSQHTTTGISKVA
jgi:hypothetical protein